MESGTYSPNDKVTVTAWAEGDPPPTGFKNFRSSDGTDNYIKADDNGDPTRSISGESVASIVEGGALVQYPNGEYETLYPTDLENFERVYVLDTPASDPAATPVAADNPPAPTTVPPTATAPVDTTTAPVDTTTAPVDTTTAPDATTAPDTTA